MQRVTVYDSDGNAVNCWPDTEDEPKKARGRKPKKSDEVATEVDED